MPAERAPAHAEADQVTSIAGSPSHQAIIIFDGLCNLCDRTVQFVLARDRRGYFSFAPAQSAAAAPILARCGLQATPGSIVLVDDEGCWTKSSATLRIARALGFPWSMAGILLWMPRPLRDAAYGIIARNRVRWFGQRAACRVPSTEQARRFLS
jgi:predicted DCC family thiol-disulfide oxidoreductase YuxK